MARAPFPIADRVSLADVGEYMKRKSDGHEGLALGEVQAALVAGCSVEFIWMKEGREVCREYPEPDFFRRPILGWHWVVPRRLQVQLPLEERKGDTLLTFLRLSEAVRHGLRPASEAPQAERQPQQPPPAPPPDESAIADPAPVSASAADVGDQVGAVTSGDTEAPPEPEPEYTRWQRDRTIEAIKTLHPPHGIRPKGTSIQALTNRINKLPEFQGNQVSDDTVGRALKDIETAPEK
jgi:hypothetical protein